MFWILSIGVSCIAGLLIGLRYRAPAALAASAAIAITTATAGVLNHWSVTETLGLVVLCIGLLQTTYLVGVAIASRR